MVRQPREDFMLASGRCSSSVEPRSYRELTCAVRTSFAGRYGACRLARNMGTSLGGDGHWVSAQKNAAFGLYRACPPFRERRVCGCSPGVPLLPHDVDLWEARWQLGWVALQVRFRISRKVVSHPPPAMIPSLWGPFGRRMWASVHFCSSFRMRWRPVALVHVDLGVLICNVTDFKLLDSSQEAVNCLPLHNRLTTNRGFSVCVWGCSLTTNAARGI